MKKLKKIIPFIISLSLALGCAPTAVFADDSVTAGSSAESSVEDSTADVSVSDDNISDSTNEETVIDEAAANDGSAAITDSGIPEETTDINTDKDNSDITDSEDIAENKTVDDNSSEGVNESENIITGETDVIIDDSLLDSTVSESSGSTVPNEINNDVSNNIANGGELIVDFAAGTAVTTDENLIATTDIMTLEAPIDGISDPLATADPESLEANVLLGAPAPEKTVKEQIFDKLNNG